MSASYPVLRWLKRHGLFPSQNLFKKEEGRKRKSEGLGVFLVQKVLASPRN